MSKAETIECDKCFSIMEEVCRVTKLADLPEDARPCQQARYFSVIETGEYGEWAMTVVTYACKKCGNKKVVQQR
jgi:hypothetical protein